MAYWLVKTEPEDFSWDEQTKRGAKGASRSTDLQSLRLASGECGGKNSKDRLGRALLVLVMCTGPYRQ